MILENGTVIRTNFDLLDALRMFNVPSAIIEAVQNMCDSAQAVERVGRERLDSDLRSYEGSLETYRDALSEILDQVENDRTKKGVTIRRIIENVL